MVPPGRPVPGRSGASLPSVNRDRGRGFERRCGRVAWIAHSLANRAGISRGRSVRGRLDEPPGRGPALTIDERRLGLRAARRRLDRTPDLDPASHGGTHLSGAAAAPVRGRGRRPRAPLLRSKARARGWGGGSPRARREQVSAPVRRPLIAQDAEMAAIHLARIRCEDALAARGAGDALEGRARALEPQREHGADSEERILGSREEFIRGQFGELGAVAREAAGRRASAKPTGFLEASDRLRTRADTDGASPCLVHEPHAYLPVRESEDEVLTERAGGHELNAVREPLRVVVAPELYEREQLTLDRAADAKPAYRDEPRSYPEHERRTDMTVGQRSTADVLREIHRELLRRSCWELVRAAGRRRPS